MVPRAALAISGWSSPGHILVSPGAVILPGVTTYGTLTVNDAVSEQPFAFVTVTKTTVSVVIPVVVKTLLTTSDGLAGTPPIVKL